MRAGHLQARRWAGRALAGTLALLAALGCDETEPTPDAGEPTRDAGPGRTDAGPGRTDAGPPGPCEEGSPGVSGLVRDDAGAALAGARVTLVGTSASYFRELRSGADGSFTFAGVPAGTYLAGASLRDRAYVEQTVEVTTDCAGADLALGPETEVGSWETLGDPGERLGGTNSAVLLPDGRLMFCHDTVDPVIYDPIARTVTPGPTSPRLQGCHAVSLLPDGRVIYVGGADRPVYGPGTRQVKTFDPVRMMWEVQPDMNDYRWYPTMVPLPDGQLLTVGGGGVDNPIRTDTSETLDPATMTWTPAGDISIGNEVSPIVLLFTGEALMTHRPPQLYNPGTRSWRLAADFVQSPRTPDGDHADHELILMPDGRVLAIGYRTYSPGEFGQMLEIYDPATDRWALGATIAPVRSRASVVLLPDRRVLVMGGEKEESSDPTPTNEWGQVALTDLYDADRDSWRRLADLSVAREYHAMPILLPDGRVLITGGEEAPGREPSASVVEVFRPPYLSRGPRPMITELSTTELRRGEAFTLRFANTEAPTSVALLGMHATTHFMDSGPGRYLELSFTQDGDSLSVTVPSEPARALYGYYLLIVMVDDIPSEARVVRVTPG